jgi:hypothetical protein
MRFEKKSTESNLYKQNFLSKFFYIFKKKEERNQDKTILSKIFNFNKKKILIGFLIFCLHHLFK